MGRHVLHVHTVQLQPAVFPHLIVVVSVPLGESPLLADKDLLASRELELGAPKSLNTFGLEKSKVKYQEISNLFSLFVATFKPVI